MIAWYSRHVASVACCMLVCLPTDACSKKKDDGHAPFSETASAASKRDYSSPKRSVLTEHYPRTPVTFASDNSLGVAVADLDGDDFPEIVVADGDDQAMSHVVVFHNDHGVFAHDPWKSEDVDYHTGVALGDLDHDGSIDIAVSVGPDRTTSTPGGVKVYFNHNGTLDPRGTPLTNEGYKSVGCAIGDADGDGHLDLAAAVAEEQDHSAGPTRVYEAPTGTVSNHKVWRSENLHATGAKFADLDGDGLLDLVIQAPGIPAYMGTFGANGSVTLSKTPKSIADTDIKFPMDVAVARMGKDSAVVVSYANFDPDAGGSSAKAIRHSSRIGTPGAAADATCTPTPGRSSTYFLAYRFDAARVGPQKPFWNSPTPGWGYGVALGQTPASGPLELIAARLGPSADGGGAPLWIFLQKDLGFEKQPAWTSNTCTAQEYVALADLRRQSIESTSESFMVNGPRAVITLSKQIVDHIQEIRKNGTVVPKQEYASIPGGNWISFGRHLAKGDKIDVQYTYPNKLDIILTNADSDNAIYYYDGPPKTGIPKP